jgi:hypothetical protein
MHYCQEEIQGLVLQECGKPAGLKAQGRWLCAFHFDSLQKALARWVRRKSGESLVSVIDEFVLFLPDDPNVQFGKPLD